MSLRRLGLERIDLFQLHRIDPKVPLEDQVGELKKLQDEGKIRHIGLSEVSVDQLKAAQEIATIVSVQNLYNLEARRRGAARLVDRARHRLHPVVPARDRRPDGRGLPADRAGEAQAPPRPARARLAAPALAGDAADPRHVKRRPPRGQHRRATIELTDDEFEELAGLHE